MSHTIKSEDNQGAPTIESKKASQAENNSDQSAAGGVTKKRKIGTPTDHKTLARVVDLKLKGVKQTEIAKITGQSTAAVCKQLQRFDKIFELLPKVEEYRQGRTELLDATELRLLQAINDPTKLQNATLNQAAFAFEKVAHYSRLWQDKSTDNVNTQVFYKRDKGQK